MMKRWVLGGIIFVSIMILLFIGRIISPPSFSPPFGCSETDGGRDYYTAGTVTIISQPEPAPTPTPTPESDTSKVSVSDDSETIAQEEIVPASKPASAVSSNSPMATQKLIGLRLSPDGESFEDSCLDSKNVKEYYCDGDSYATQNKFCPNGCENGACVKGREPYCSHIGTDQEGWYNGETGALIRHAQCDGDSPKCKTPGFSGVMQ
jgi:hypothetical protein